VLELGQLIWRKVNNGTKAFRYVSDTPYSYDVQTRSPDVSKAERLLGFRAQTSLDHILDEVIPWVGEQIRHGQI
jgi:UDP-glucose 4-epimerase